MLVSAAHYFPETARAIMSQVTTEGHTEEEWEFMRKRHLHGDEQIRALKRVADNFRIRRQSNAKPALRT